MGNEFNFMQHQQLDEICVKGKGQFWSLYIRFLVNCKLNPLITQKLPWELTLSIQCLNGTCG